MWSHICNLHYCFYLASRVRSYSWVKIAFFRMAHKCFHLAWKLSAFFQEHQQTTDDRPDKYTEFTIMCTNGCRCLKIVLGKSDLFCTDDEWLMVMLTYWTEQNKFNWWRATPNKWGIAIKSLTLNGCTVHVLMCFVSIFITHYVSRLLENSIMRIETFAISIFINEMQPLCELVGEPILRNACVLFSIW